MWRHHLNLNFATRNFSRKFTKQSNAVEKNYNTLLLKIRSKLLNKFSKTQVLLPNYLPNVSIVLLIAITLPCC